jgi:hypothetical protein
LVGTLLFNEKICQSNAHCATRYPHQTALETQIPAFLGTGLAEKIAVCALTAAEEWYI